MSVTGWMVVLCIGCGIAFAASFVEAAGGKRGLPEKGELTKTFNEKARVQTPPARPPEKPPTSSRESGPPPPKGFKNPGF